MPRATLRVSKIAQHVAPASASVEPRFAGQVAIVTGGARGIGYACAERFAREGMVGIALFDMQHSQEAVANLEKLGAKVLAVTLDLTRPEEVTAGVATVMKEFKKIDVVVQAAGITGVTNLKTHEVDPENFRMIFDVNVFGIFLVCKAVLPHMLEAGYGRILNVASISGKDGNPGQLGYSTSKAAVIGMTKVMGKDYANIGKDIRINCIAPAVVYTDLVKAMPKEQVDMMCSKIPMGRTGQLPEIAGTIAFACSKECSFTTGFCFDFSGGRAVY